jgi:3-oxoacyl-[acyl-carrier protein] reductase
MSEADRGDGVDMAGKVALVTGGGRGIGRAICLDLGRQGAAVGVNYRVDAEAAMATAEAVREAGGKAVPVAGDVSDSAHVTAMVNQVRDQFGPIDYLVNNAGFSRLTPVESLDYAEWRKVLDINLDGPFLTTWAVKDEMIARGGGAIVNITSVAGLVPNIRQVHYGTSKAALGYFTKVCARALAPHGIRVNAVAPGFTWTDRVQTIPADSIAPAMAEIPLGRGAQPEEISAAVMFLLSDKAGYITGQLLPVCGGRA